MDPIAHLNTRAATFSDSCRPVEKWQHLRSSSPAIFCWIKSTLKNHLIMMIMVFSNSNRDNARRYSGLSNRNSERRAYVENMDLLKSNERRRKEALVLLLVTGSAIKNCWGVNVRRAFVLFFWISIQFEEYSEIKQRWETNDGIITRNLSEKWLQSHLANRTRLIWRLMDVSNQFNFCQIAYSPIVCVINQKYSISFLPNFDPIQSTWVWSSIFISQRLISVNVRRWTHKYLSKIITLLLCLCYCFFMSDARARACVCDTFLCNFLATN